MRLWLRWLVCASLLIASSAPGVEPPSIQSVDAVGMTVGDMDRSIAFYRDVLSFKELSDVELAGSDYEHLEGVFGLRIRVVRMKLGDEIIELTEYLTPRGRTFPADTRSNDHWFQHMAIVVRDMDRAYAQLRLHHVQHASTAPQTLPATIRNAAGIRAFYFRDPDGHFLELLHFPRDKGEARWHGSGDRLFLGIDHTAIVVDDTDTSLKFYRDRLGMRVAGESDNFGTEQEHLNNIFGAHLRITSLRAEKGPGIELLEYVAPHDGRSLRGDIRANDLVHWQTRLIGRDIDALTRGLERLGVDFVSPGAVLLNQSEVAGFTKAVLVRDADGHALEIVQP